GEAVLRNLVGRTGVAHLAAQGGGLTHRHAEVAGDDHHADLVEDRVELGDRFGFLRTIHALLLHKWSRAYSCARPATLSVLPGQGGRVRDGEGGRRSAEDDARSAAGNLFSPSRLEIKDRQT